MQSKELEECIDLEMVKTEKRRLEIFLGVMIFGLILLILNLTLFPTTISDVFLDARSMKLGVYTSLAFILLLILSRVMVGKLASCEKPLPVWYKIYSISIDTLVPFIWLYFMIKWEQNGTLLDSPLVYIFATIIIVSALHLNFWLSFLNGFLIAMIYATITFWVFEEFDTNSMLPSLVYYIKAVLFLMAGVCAGLVARELNNRLTVSIKTQEERNKIEELFNQQVSKQVASALKSEGDFSLKAEAAVLFLDIRDFTQRVQFLSPEEVNTFQNKFFGPIIDCINRNDGLINQIMGDGLMATFTSIDNERHEEKAFKAASEILQKIEEMNKESEDDIKVGIGIHSGEIIAGNIGNEERRQFSISGIPVITAARLEQMTKDYDCSFLVSIDFYNKIKHISENGTSLGMVKLKGLDQQMELIKLA